MTEIISELIQVAKAYTSNSTPDGYTRGDSAFIDYILEDKSKYPFVCDLINTNTNTPYRDLDNDFKLGESGGFLMNIDFMVVNVDIFSRTANYYQANNRYTPHPIGSNKYSEFWNTETARRKQGAIANCKLYFKDVEEYYNDATTDDRRKELLQPLRITGDHYNYLNYGRIDRVPNAIERAELDASGMFKVETIAGFPRYWDGDYWNFKIDEFIANNKFNLCKAKARRKGFSYKRGSQAANTLNLNKNVTVILAAAIDEYLIAKDATGYMTKVNLDWYENHTAWQRGYLSEKISNIELGYKKRTEGNKSFGYRSKLICAAVERNESALIGKKAIEIDVEEAGKCSNLQRVVDVTLSNMESGSIKIGTLRVYGTAGTEAKNWIDFANMYYNPKVNNMLPLEDIWNRDKRYNTCGFFFPQIWCYEPYVYNGNSLIISAYNFDKNDKNKARVDKDSKAYTTYVAQRANTPDEAFINSGDNIFGSPELNNHIADLKTNDTLKFYRDGWYEFDTNGGVNFLTRQECIDANLFRGVRFHEYIMDVPHNNKTDVHGCVREYYQPAIVNGVVPGDTYVCFLDAYRVDKVMNEITDKHSLYSWQIYTRGNATIHGGGKRLVAEYTGRLNTMEDNDRELLKALLRYNAKVLIEAGTGETITNFKKWHYRHLLLKDPLLKINRGIENTKKESYGIVIGDTDVKYDGLRMIKEYLYEIVGYTDSETPIYRLNYIYSISLLLELQRFNTKGNFDRISTMILAMYEFLKDSTIKREKVSSTSTLSNILLNRK